MIDSITGIIQRKEPTNLFIDMNGMVFNISICLRDYEELPDLNQEITILTYLNVREDLMELYGFLEYERRRLFTQLIGVSGIGPRNSEDNSIPGNQYDHDKNLIDYDIEQQTHAVFKNIKSILAPELSKESINKINLYFSHLTGVGLDFPERK